MVSAIGPSRVGPEYSLSSTILITSLASMAAGSLKILGTALARDLDFGSSIPCTAQKSLMSAYNVVLVNH